MFFVSLGSLGSLLDLFSPLGLLGLLGPLLSLGFFKNGQLRWFCGSLLANLGYSNPTTSLFGVAGWDLATKDNQPR